MREAHKSIYTQAIPGINRLDDHVRFTQGEKCIQHFGDALPPSEKLLLDATNAQQRGRHTKYWCETTTKIGESSIRDTFASRDAKVRQWKEHLNKEVDKLAKEIERVEAHQREVFRRRQYLSDVTRVSEMTAEFRKRRPDREEDDIDRLQLEELHAALKTDGDLQQCFRDLKECQRQMESARRALMSEVELKAFSLNISRRTQHAEPILSFPYKPEDHPSDQIYHPNTEEDWEKDLADKIQKSVATRQEASTCCLRTAATVKDGLSRVADAWFRTSKALQEAVQRDERALFNVQNRLQTVGENITSTKQRLASLNDDMRMQNRGKNLQLWRLQTLTYRPGADHIRDAPVRRLEKELGNIEKRGAFVTEGITRNKELLSRLEEEKLEQTLLMEKLTKKLFIERENCLGLRRTVAVEGVGLQDYVTDL
ncbi:tektin-5-like [Argiope bruennichi]|uniref:tektin-5-like n=1 Tax=Argiope bruennichi TaxID=94029 RepID=UPI0024954643|nr:tektin-5-like [Argiope bruennichi]